MNLLLAGDGKTVHVIGRSDEPLLASALAAPADSSKPKSVSQQLRTGLADVLVRGVTPSPHQAMLVPLLASLDLVKHVVDKDDRKQARATAKEIGKAAKDGKLVSQAVSQTVANTQLALLLVIMTPAITASTT